MIAIPHALLVLGNLAKSMGLLDAQMDEIFQCFHGSKLTTANSCYRRIAKGGFVMRKDHMLTREFLRHAETLEDSLHKERCQLWSPIHGSFTSVDKFLHTKAQTITKDFVLQPKSGGPSDMQTATVYRTNSVPRVPTGANPMHPNPAEEALPKAVYRHDHAHVNDISDHPEVHAPTTTNGATHPSSGMHLNDHASIASHSEVGSVNKTQVNPLMQAPDALQPAVYRLEPSNIADSNLCSSGSKHPMPFGQAVYRETSDGAANVGEALPPPPAFRPCPFHA